MNTSVSDVREMTMRDLNNLSLEELAFLPEWMVPPSRKSELIKHKARKRRRVKEEKTPEERQKEIEAARLRAGLKTDGSNREWWDRSPGGNDAARSTKYGPRGGRYTEGRTKEGGSYRRYF